MEWADGFKKDFPELPTEFWTMNELPIKLAQLKAGDESKQAKRITSDALLCAIYGKGGSVHPRCEYAGWFNGIQIWKGIQNLCERKEDSGIVEEEVIT